MVEETTYMLEEKCPECGDSLYTFYHENVSGDPETGAWYIECDRNTCEYSVNGSFADEKLDGRYTVTDSPKAVDPEQVEQELTIKIDPQGLWLNRAGTLTRAMCPYGTASKVIGQNKVEGQFQCGSWCSLFHEPVEVEIFKKNNVKITEVSIELCNGNEHSCDKENFKDERVEE